MLSPDFSLFLSSLGNVAPYAPVISPAGLGCLRGSLCDVWNGPALASIGDHRMEQHCVTTRWVVWNIIN